MRSAGREVADAFPDPLYLERVKPGGGQEKGQREVLPSQGFQPNSTCCLS
jgi:hypothetical protein